ncbi:type IV toxin-antitoxin system AbiEi family antitoxin [Isoptericola croceus]|uniref:type IV toxin-antitoxin system AbiEi family antitoxin n=1 Tax=Isoptericola croceus TaxID=3031406 RepID=UPI0023F956D8|nr:type IV toxin-antitoxin system AbiEi family antitoxin [Isoptericola croceus]
MSGGRTLGPSLARVVEELELNQPVVVTLTDLDTLLVTLDIKTRATEVARRLRETGWLLATKQRGVYEFAPGAHAGPFGHGDPLIALRAFLASNATGDSRNATACLHTAVWIHGLADRAPNQHELALPKYVRVPSALAKTFRIVRYDSPLAPEYLTGVPVHRPASILVHMATSPSSVRNWPVLRGAMQDLIERTSQDDLEKALDGATTATLARLGYLLDGLGTTHMHLASLGVRRPDHTVWFGPRDGVVTFNARWNIADTTANARNQR